MSKEKSKKIRITHHEDVLIRGLMCLEERLTTQIVHLCNQDSMSEVFDKFLSANSFLRKKGTNQIFRYTSILARRDDMEFVPVNFPTREAIDKMIRREKRTKRGE